MPHSPIGSAARCSCCSSRSRPLSARRLYVLCARHRRLTQQLRPASLRLADGARFSTASLAALAARDRSTAAHSRAVAVYARDIAAALGLPHREQQLAHQCALVHDLGKLALPPSLLEKPAQLTPAERRQLE